MKKDSSFMPTIAQFVVASRDLLTPDAHTTNFALFGSPHLTGVALDKFAEIVRRAASDTLYLHFGNRIEDGPVGFQFFMPRQNVMIVCPLSELWAPAGQGSCVLVGADDHTGYQAIANGGMVLKLGCLEADLRPGIRRGRQRLIDRARGISSERTSNYSAVELRL